MFKRRPALVASIVIALIGGSVEGACGPAPQGGTGGTGGSTGGVGGTGGSTGPSGCAASSVAGGAGVDGTATKCSDAPAQDLPLDGFPVCNMTACQHAHCIPKTLIPTSIDQKLLGTGSCDSASLCIPDEYAKPLGKFRTKKCTSLANTEGRCISTCIPKVNGLMDVLPKTDCGQDEVCAPCYNPNDGTPTGACSQGCDTGPTQPPYRFKTCQGGTGVCAPTSIIPPVLMTQLVQFECAAGEVCAPIAKTQNLKYNFPACQPSNPFTALLAGVGPNGQTGGCVPQWLADANPIEGIFMAQDTCQTGEKCAPCNNPLRGGVPTGACAVPLCSDPNGGAPPGVPMP